MLEWALVFVKKFNMKIGKKIKSIPLDVMSALQAYHWPGNVRELENIIERAVILNSGVNLEISEELLEHSSKPQDNYLRTLKENERSTSNAQRSTPNVASQRSPGHSASPYFEVGR